MVQKRLLGFTTIDQSKIRTRGEGVQKPENFADVLYVWSQRGTGKERRDRRTTRISFFRKGDGYTRKNTHTFLLSYPVIDGHLVSARVNILLNQRREYLSL